MTAVQMEFLGLKEFECDEMKQQVRMLLHVDNIGDIPIQIQLENRKFDSAKVVRLNDIANVGCVQGTASS